MRIGYGVVGVADIGHRRESGERIVPVYELYVVHKHPYSNGVVHEFQKVCCKKG